MQTKYTIAQYIKHGMLYPIRYLMWGKARPVVWKAILARQNSVPLYLAVFRGDTAVQVGTPNIRTVARYSKLLGSKGRLFVIEADPENAENLRKIVSESEELRNVEIIGKGAWSSAQMLPLMRSNEFDGDHKFAVNDVFMDNDFRESSVSEELVEVDTVDNLLSKENVDSINYIGITVNGAEYEVLKGAQSILRESRNVRVYSKGHARVGSAQSQNTIAQPIIRLLMKLGYKTVASKGERSSADVAFWKTRSGDVFGWKN